MNFKTLLRISRPRFWHYVLGPMLIYFASSRILTQVQESFLEWWTVWIFQIIGLFIVLWYFTLPANLWIYGRNDIADGDTDKFNIKKWSYEAKIDDSKMMKNKLTWNIWWWNIGYILISCLIFWYLSWNYDNTINNLSYSLMEYSIQYIIKPVIVLLPFYLTSYLYSCNPLRAKAKPFIDGIMNILYIITPFSIIFRIDRTMNYMAFSLQEVFPLMVASLLRCMAMHCYSAIPDIEPDKQAGLTTTAVYLGKQNSLIYCWALYLVSAIFSFPTLGWFSILWWLVYLTMIFISYYRKDIFALYKLFPYINLIIWFLLFWYIILYS